ncbi:MAG: ABC transporter substrate-binding protein [Candidatus Niameybacter stercoravium]|nr:ABC transporter substrate-binding protein [Candidatus Niameybacter stercoravium]
MKKFLKQLTLLGLAGAMIFGTVGCSQQPKEAPAEENVQGQTEQVENTFPVTITDSTGTEITMTQAPERIVSLAPSTTEILGALGVTDKLVGRTKYCDFPEEALAAEEVGGTSNPNIETIVALNPDLVVASTHVSDEVISKLREVNIPVAFLNEQEDFDGTYSAIENIGLLVGRSKEAEAVVNEMKATVESVVERINNLEEDEVKPRVYYAVWAGDSDSTATGDTFIGQMIELAGGDNIAKDATMWSISKEKIVEGDPDMIIIPAGKGLKETLMTTDFYKDLRAVQEGHIYEIDDNMISRQGPRLAQAFEDLAQIIHPEAE